MKKIRQLLPLLLAVTLLSGCGKQTELEAYTEQMNAFYEQIDTISASINGIDPEEESASEDLLQKLNDMEQAFAELEAISVPSDYEANAELSQKANSSMQQSVSLYHQAFAGEAFDADLAAEAASYYEDAMNYVSAIGKVMMGYTLETE